MPTATGLVEYIKRGTHDDGAEGVILTKIAQGRLVKVPISTSVVTATDGSKGTVTFNKNNNLNADGSQQNLSMTVNAGYDGYAYAEQTVWGRVVGVRWRRLGSSGSEPFAVQIDGAIYKVPRTKNTTLNGTSGQSDYEALWVVADDLIDGPHHVRIIVTGDAALSGAVTRSVLFFGFIAEGDKGYNQPTPRSVITSATALSTSSTSVSPTGTLRKLRFYNTGASTRIVTVRQSGVTFWQAVLTAAGTAGATAELDFGGQFVPNSLSVIQDAGTDVNMFQQIEGYLP